MYSCRFPHGAGVPNSQPLKESGQVGSGELPFERLGEDLVLVLESEDPGGELVELFGSGSSIERPQR